MARIIYTGLVSEINGKIAGQTFQKNRSGFIIRNSPSNKKGISSKSSTILERTRGLQSHWLNLSGADRSAWNAFALIYTRTNKWGQTKQLTGLNWFLAINNNCLLTNNPILDTPPSYVVPIAVPNYTISIGSEILRLRWIPDFDHSNDYLVVWASSFCRDFNLSNRRQFHPILIINPGTSGTVDITSAWEDYFGLVFPTAASGFMFSIKILVQSINKVSFISGLGNRQVRSNF